MSLVDELKRRNVFKVGAAYLALGWLTVQLTSIIAPALHLPDWTIPLVLWLGVIGFPFVVVFSWVYELTPEGLKRESEIDRSQSITHVTGKRLDNIIIALLVVAIGLFVLDRVFPGDAVSSVGAGHARDAGPTVGAGHARDSADDGRGHGPLLQGEVSTPVPDEKSIAVLPFADMSQGKDQEYFSDGMSEELLNLLAQVPDLKVIARTSSFAFKGKDVPIAEIARQLNVAHVLEGSVRKSGNTVRITAQLVRAADSVHLWSDTYDRPLDDIFKVQDEIANAIVQALQIRLAGGELSRRKGGTQNLEAYQLNLRAWSAMRQNTRSSLDAARKYLEQATKLDPHYGLAWYGLATWYLMQGDVGFLAPQEGFERSRQLAQHALQLSPDLAQAHATLSYVHMAFDWDWAAAESEAKQAFAIDPTDPAVLLHAGILSRTLGRWEEAEQQFRAALVRDPLDAWVIANLGQLYYLSGRFADSEGMYRKVLELEPDFLWARPNLGKTLLAQGKVEDALAMVQQEADEGSRLWFLPMILQAAGHQAEADAALQSLVSLGSATRAFYVAQNYAWRGDRDRALEWLERAYQQRDASLIEILGEPLFRNIANDPRFIAFLRKMNLPTEPVPVNWQ